MSKSLRLSEKWFQRGLWLVAFVFAAFLIGLGSTVVGDLPQVEKTLALDDFIEQPAATQLRENLKTAERQGRQAQEALEQARLKLRVAQANSRSASETFNNWLATRRATERAEQDPELLERTRALDGLKTAERQALATMEAEQQKALDASQGATRTRERIAELERAAQDKWQSARRAQELRVFLYRLALTLPLLVAAGWLFAKKRKSTYWPFVWGFIFFCTVRLLCRTRALPAQLRRLCALHRRHPHHGAGRAAGDCFTEPLPGKAETRRAAARCAAPRGAEL